MPSPVQCFPKMAETHNVWDELTPAQKAKVRKLQGESTAGGGFTPSEGMLAEFGMFFGWGALLAAANGDMPADTFAGLLEAARAHRKRQRAENLIDMFTAVACAQSKNGAKRVNNVVRKIIG